MVEERQLNVLLVEDDEDDFILARAIFSEITGQQYTLDWQKTFQDGLNAMIRNGHDVCLIDFRLGARNGIELLQAAVNEGCQAPIILLTGQGEHEVDLEAMKAGAADYLVKSRLDPIMLERSIRYAIERKRAASFAAFEQARLAAFGAEVGLALTRNEPLETILNRCAGAMTQYLNAAHAQIWIYDAEQKVLAPRATAPAGHGSEATRFDFRIPNLTIDFIAQGKPILISPLAGDDRMPDQEWVQREGLLAYAAHPLMLEGRLVGLMSMFSHAPLAESVLREMASVANGIALCIERKRSKDALEVSESKYRSVVESIKEVVFQTNEFGHWTFLNPAWQEMTGFNVKETLGTVYLEYIHHDDRDQNRYVFLQLVERKLNFCRYETRYLTKDGKTRWVEVYVQLLFDPADNVLGTSGTLTDITERKQAEMAIQKLAAFPRVNPNPVLEFAADGSLTYFNDAAQAKATSLGKEHPLAILPPNVSEIVQQCLASEQNRLREVVSIAGRSLSWSFFPILPSHVVHCYGADITDMLNLEAQFRHAQKLESVGRLAAGIAHDFNNILMVIQGFSEVMLSDCNGDANRAEPLKKVLSAAQRATSLTRQLMMFSRKQVIQTHVLDLNAIVRNMSNLLPRLLGEDIALETICGPELPRIEADTGMIEQIVMNLAVNARDAMPDGGKIIIASSSVELDDTYAKTHPEARGGCFVCLTVTDTGCGMDTQTLNRIFEPFFTTKPTGKGTGLGLATTYGIVKQHRGWIEVKSQPGSGTTFAVFFPRSATTAAAPSNAASDVAPAKVGRGKNETILVVEDEFDLRTLVKKFLKEFGYTVLEASTGVEGLQVWDAHADKIDLVLTDIVMPDGVTGLELAAQLRTRKPDLKVIFTSGYSADISGNDHALLNEIFLPKPYSIQKLAQIIRNCLDAEPAPTAK